MPSETQAPSIFLLSRLSLALVLRLVPHGSKMATLTPASLPASFPGRKKNKRQRHVSAEAAPF